eukprot:SAG31_NODE_31360_length_369_cov_0.759259_1_plen_122_part_11
MKDTVEKIKDVRARLEEATDRSFAMNTEEEHLGWVKTTFTDIVDAGTILQPVEKLWNTAWDFQQSQVAWMSVPFAKLKADDVNGTVDQMKRDLKSLTRLFGGENKEEGPFGVAVGVSEKIKA